MKIFVDARAVFTQQGGVGKTIVELVHRLSSEYQCEIFVASNVSNRWEDMEHVTLINYKPTKGGYSIEKRIAWEQIALRKMIAKCAVDVAWFPWNYGVPYALKTPSLLTVHDIIPLRKSNPMGSRYRSFLYSLAVKQSLHSANLIATPSNYTKNELIRQCGVQPSKVKVAHWGVDKKKPVFKKFVDVNEVKLLYVGGHEPRKNVKILFETLRILNDTQHEFNFSLKMTGLRENLCPEAISAFNSLKGQHRIKFLGYVPQRDLDGVYTEADIFIFPSLEEGFGFPPLEAQSLAVPVICGTADSIPEVTGNAALQVDVTDPMAVASAVISLVKDGVKRSSIVERGLNSSSEFNWDNCAKQYYGFFRKVIEERH